MQDIKLHKGDCFDFLKDIKETIDLIVTDPPYLIPAINGGGSINQKRKLNEILKSSLVEGVDITKGYDIDGFAKIVQEIQNDNINAYFWCNKNQIPDYFKTYVEGLKCKFDILSWCKTNPIPTFSNKYLSDCEYCLYFHKGKGKTKPKSYDAARTVWFEPINIKDKQRYGHPTIKPLKIIQTIIENSSSVGDTILDPFMGSGTSGVACINTNRKFIGIEIDDKYFEIAKKRIKETENDLKLF